MPVLTMPAYYLRFNYADKEFIWGLTHEGYFFTPMVSSVDGWVLTEYDVDDVDYLTNKITIHGEIVEFTILDKDLDKELKADSLPLVSKFKNFLNANKI